MLNLLKPKTKKLELGDLFIVSDISEIISFSIVLYSGKYDLQNLAQVNISKENEKQYLNIAKTIAEHLDLEIEKIHTIVIEAVDKESDQEMIKALEKGKTGKHKNIDFLCVLEEPEQIENINSLFISDDKTNRDMAAYMLIAAINDTLEYVLNKKG